MFDLLLSLSGMMVLGILAAVGGATLQKRGGRIAVVFGQITMAAGMAGYLIWIWDRPLLIQLMPYSNAIIVGNWLPVLGAFFVGICLQTECIMWVRRLVLGSSLAGLCCYSLINPLLGESPQCRTTHVTGKLLDFQTTDQTCSAACAAGLLRLHGIEATEEELAQLCLTRKGTHWLGVFRGLKIKTAGTEWDVEVNEVSCEQLLSTANLTGVLALTFSAEAEQHSVESGFGSEIGHTVVSLGANSTGGLDVFDPSPDYGFETWNARILEDVENGILLRLVSRKGTKSPFEGLDTYRPSKWNVRQLAVR